MSAWGFGGFANGFLQGFNTMGQEFARRGLMRRERETSARDERRLALEEEIQRGNARRADEEAALLNEQRQMNNDILRPQVPYAPDAAARANEAGNLELQRSRFQTEVQPKIHNLGVQETEADIKSKDIANQYAGQEKQANLAHAGAQTAYTQAQTQGVNASTDAKKIEIDALKKQQAAEARASAALERADKGAATEEDLNLLSGMAGIALTPNVRQHLAALGRAQQKLVESKGQYDPTHDPEIIGAMNEMLKEPLNKNRGLELDGGKYRVVDTQLREFARGQDNPGKLNPILNVTVEPTDAFKAQQEAVLNDPQATPEQKQQARTLLEPKVLVKPLTRGRVPFEEGGEAARFWLGPEDFQKLAMGYERLAEWQEGNPELVQRLQKLQAKRTLGMPLLQGEDTDKALERDIKVRKENRDTLRFQQENQQNKLKRLDAIIAKSYGQATLDRVFELGGENAQRARAEQLEASRVLRENPDFDEDQIMAEVEKTLGANRKAPAKGDAKKSQGKDFSSLW